MRILFLSRWFPYPPDNGSRIRISSLIRHLSSRHQVDLVSFASEPVTEEQGEAMRRYCRRVQVVRHRPFQPRRLTAWLGLFSRRPRSVIDTYSVEMQQCVQKAGLESAPDVVIASQVDMAPYAMALPGVPRLFEEVELSVLYEQYARQRHPIKRLRKGMMWWKSSRYVAGLLRAFDGCTVVSAQERDRVLQVLPGYSPIGLVPNGVDAAYYAADFGAPQADSLIYSGSLTYFANLDAMSFFSQQVLPIIRSERPNVKLSITGRLDGAPLDRLAHDDGVVLTGCLDDVRPAVARSWVSVVPLRIGGGTRLKILESLALGTPVVSTSKGAEGLNLVPGRDLLIADEPAELAASVLRVLRDAGLRETLSRNGRRAVAAQYDWQTIGQGLSDLVEDMITNRTK